MVTMPRPFCAVEIKESGVSDDLEWTENARENDRLTMLGVPGRDDVGLGISRCRSARRCRRGRDTLHRLADSRVRMNPTKDDNGRLRKVQCTVPDTVTVLLRDPRKLACQTNGHVRSGPVQAAQLVDDDLGDRVLLGLGGFRAEDGRHHLRHQEAEGHREASGPVVLWIRHAFSGPFIDLDHALGVLHAACKRVVPVSGLGVLGHVASIVLDGEIHDAPLGSGVLGDDVGGGALLLTTLLRDKALDVGVGDLLLGGGLAEVSPVLRGGGAGAGAWLVGEEVDLLLDDAIEDGVGEVFGLLVVGNHGA